MRRDQTVTSNIVHANKDLPFISFSSRFLLKSHNSPFNVAKGQIPSEEQVAPRCGLQMFPNYCHQRPSGAALPAYLHTARKETVQINVRCLPSIARGRRWRGVVRSGSGNSRGDMMSGSKRPQFELPLKIRKGSKCNGTDTFWIYFYSSCDFFSQILNFHTYL